MFKGKPIIGIVGGIGSGKSYVASLFGELGCLVIYSDDQVREAYVDPFIETRLREWWGDHVFTPGGAVNRSAIADIVFQDAGERRRLEQLVHPFVARKRDEAMAAAGESVAAFVWDTPLLIETGLDKLCDAIVFVDASEAVRRSRVASRGWGEGEMGRREILQMGVDKKRAISHYVVDNTVDVAKVISTERANNAEEAVARAVNPASVRGQVREILSRILANPRV